MTFQGIPGGHHHYIVGGSLIRCSWAEHTWIAPFSGAHSHRSQIHAELFDKFKISGSWRLDEHIKVRSEIRKETRVLVAPTARFEYEHILCCQRAQIEHRRHRENCFAVLD